MLELDEHNVVDYLRGLGLVERDERAAAQALAWGVSNAVLRVDMPDRSVVVKQARAQLRTREPWFSRLERAYREADAMRVLAARLPAGVVPPLLFEDRPNYAFGMVALPPHRVWKQALLDGEADATIARHAGEILGTIHSTTAGDPTLAGQFADRQVFIELRVEPFYWRMKPRHPELAETIDRIVGEMDRTRLAVTHADFSPKNLLIHAHGLSLVDYETAHWGDPAFDLGFFLSHLVLKAIRHAPRESRFLDLTRAFWDQYQMVLRPAAAADRQLAADELMPRAIDHFALCALARIDGTSPVDYLNEEPKRGRVRALVRQVLFEEMGCWDTVLSAV
jgi:5-methylthioribose kinase